jgi:hypothetical protein
MRQRKSYSRSIAGEVIFFYPRYFLKYLVSNQEGRFDIPGGEVYPEEGKATELIT